MKLNCAALAPGLIESELFGHEKGAFTGALSRKVGRFELADGGTIFLDEVGEIPLDSQVKLLRVLHEGEFERVGGASTIKVDARLIAATNRDLERAVQEGRFRPDLYYRLNVFAIRIPPLRERPEDIPLLVKHFVMKYGRKLGKRIETVPQATMDALLAKNTVALDFSGVTFIDSRGVRMLKRMRTNKLQILDCPQFIEALLEAGEDP